MRSPWICLLICVAWTVMMSGCGGSSSSNNNGGGSTAPQTVTFTFSGGTPTAAAAQIGSGTFAAASLTGNTLSVSIPSGTTNYSIAYVCPVSNGFTVDWVIDASTKDGSSFSPSCNGATLGSVTGTADATAIPGAANILVVAGNVYTGSVGSTNGTFNVNLPTGTFDVAVIAVDGAATPNVLAVKMLRSQTLPGALNSGAPIVFQISDETTLQPMAITGVPSGFVSPPYATVYYLTANGTIFLLNNNNSVTQYPALPAAAIASGDFYEFIGDSVNTGTGTSSTTIEQNIAASSVPATVSLALPAAWSYSGPTAADFPSLTFSYSGFTASVLEAGIDWQTSSSTYTAIIVTATANYQNGSTTVAVPDLSSVTGFSPAAASGTTIQWQAYIDAGAPLPFITAPPANGTFQIESNEGTYTQP